MQVLPCATVPAVPAGAIRVTFGATPLLAPQALTFDAGTLGPTPPESTAPLAIDQRNPEHRTVTVNSSTEDQILAVHENYNAGWRATLNGQTLQAVRPDGWQQGWIVPAGQGGAVDLRFTPGSSYRLALLAGLIFLIVLTWFAMPPRRRSSLTRSPLVTARTLPEATTGGKTMGALGLVAAVAIGGWWALGAIAVVLLAMWQGLKMRNILAGACAVAGLGAAMSVNADEAGVFATMSLAAAIVVLACMSVRLDAAVSGLLSGLSRRWPSTDGSARNGSDG
jgi:arabinofuranan 3-O-arabinosyltransferase